ncbi:hypothetical protein ACFRQM_49385 [Streptomyces sp. NPDC056831]|uniref:hypothetical protein n=1 Tax=Streptomyces sp. NPDC056831 TaxID=3345954 RepID=UPI00368203C2
MTDDGRVGLSTDSHFGLQKWVLDHIRCLFTGESDPSVDVSVSVYGRVALLSIPEGESVGVACPPRAGPAAPCSYARPGSATRLIEDARTADTIMNVPPSFSTAVGTPTPGTSSRWAGQQSRLQAASPPAAPVASGRRARSSRCRGWPAKWRACAWQSSPSGSTPYLSRPANLSFLVGG